MSRTTTERSFPWARATLGEETKQRANVRMSPKKDSGRAASVHEAGWLNDRRPIEELCILVPYFAVARPCASTSEVGTAEQRRAV
ncbi:MAG: hypothetical protein AUK47_25690 [Deltaproteobacteria bacterium CG2_30_63_29]|nr:MAG: hypothetical protein AUK47_25690 [Deltaproteobacteria bacterium CG2_30_63_29]PIW00203.1 MAG: hypothetical protein COW42_08515 [Deltaproteobacteria bacterium CG17_big_fil_post_rev_8_21_14_2_50_63_7]PJB33252.1 MAG: hypothetical protein CO108_31330 [Deltaproteobacteria bacterium CG_4_9_14_3_um_filter_63_12]